MADENDRKSEGKFEQLGGKVKEGIGKLTGSEQTAAEGTAQARHGKEREEDAKTEARTKGKIEELKGKVQNRVSAALGDKEKQAEGRAKEIRGSDKQEENRPSAPSMH